MCELPSRMNCDLTNFEVHYFDRRLDLKEDKEKEVEIDKAKGNRFIHS
jgi:hypothetical protein